jgi:hypothetical protein
MRRYWRVVAAAMVCAAAALAQTPTKPTTATVARKPAPAAVKPAVAKPTVAKRPIAAGTLHRPAVAAKPGAANGSGVKTAASRTASARRRGRATPRRPRQMVPAPERYQEIQQALVSKGYLKPEAASGVWGPDSGDALKRFQSEQNLQGTGKIDSLSLIALGLGPRHDAGAANPLPPVAPGQSTVQDR